MAIHQFGNQYTFLPDVPRDSQARTLPAMYEGNTPGLPIRSSEAKIIDNFNPSLGQYSHNEGGRVALTWEKSRAVPQEVEEFLMPGFRYLDDAMKMYWSDIRIPTRDSYRFMKTKVAGAAKGVQIWADELKNGRVTLPVLSISRTNHKYNVNKFSPPYSPIGVQFANESRSLARQIFRPVPYTVDYQLSIWANSKTDAEYAVYQMITRFNPMASFTVCDDHIKGNIDMTYNGLTDATVKEVEGKDLVKINYTIDISAEAWLPLPERIVPTVLGRVTSIDVE